MSQKIIIRARNIRVIRVYKYDRREPTTHRTDLTVSGHVTQNELWTPDAMLTYLSKVENLAEIFCIN